VFAFLPSKTLKHHTSVAIDEVKHYNTEPRFGFEFALVSCVLSHADNGGFMSRYYVIVLGILLIIGYSAGPAQAQQTSDPSKTTEEREETLQRLRQVEAEQRSLAESWVARRRLPLAVRQTNGRRVQLVGLEADRPVYLTTFNRMAAQATHTAFLYPDAPLGFNLTGQGLVIGLWDEGVPLQSHQELAGRVSLHDAASSDDHATHVAGTLVAAGIRSEARGMAYQARLRAYDWDDDVAEMADEAADGVLVSNHSYGVIAGWFYGDLEDTGDQWYWLGDLNVSAEEDYLFGWYDAEAAQFDRVVFSNPYLLPVVAAGNDRGDRGPSGGAYRALDASGNWQTFQASARPHARDGGDEGYDTIAGAAVAKNVLTVGAIRLDGLGVPQISSFTSFGPADDGRIKPDLVGYGERVLSSIASGTTAYALSSGTSMATPNVAGSLTLLQQYFFTLTGRSMRAATLKGLALHTADDLGSPGPDYQYGWGLLNAAVAARLLASLPENELAVLEATLEDGTAFTRPARVDEAGPLRVTLSWTDRISARLPVRGAASLDDPTPHLRNDLDLRVINETTGAVYEPFTLAPQMPTRPAVPGDNVVDPVEQVYLPHVEAGDYTLVVSHKGTLSAGTQAFSLLATGARSTVRPVRVSHLAVAESVDRVRLTWKTQFERSQGRFLIKRASVTFQPGGDRITAPAVLVGTLASPGTTDQPRDYSFEEVHVPAGRYVYQVFYEGPDALYLAGSVETVVPVPEGSALLANYPNPFRDQTRIVLDVSAPQAVTLEVFDALGRRVALVYEGTLQAGRHELPVEAAGWAPGLYLARLTTPHATRSHRLVVVR